MAISLYYTARRKKSLSPQEISAVKEIIRRHSVDEKIEKYLMTGEGLNWESFDFALNVKTGNVFRKGIVFSGSTTLPDNDEEATWVGVQHWCQCLSEIRLALTHCEWYVAVDDHSIPWDVEAKAYDPTR
ncbi:hypothetical protein H2Y57_14405 [Pectobacterium aroidearum]|uniref:Uncharacterized protein n=1 Tax=Pectobacterium aroidearum TaxID=1201031 RepID=A0AAW3ST81_9GAMM|nr:hypothetical protein [Pectobacterium aroidearum]MBA5204871.1 hypothetical protein [Pectobacterium aroidearum]